MKTLFDRIITEYLFQGLPVIWYYESVKFYKEGFYDQNNEKKTWYPTHGSANPFFSWIHWCLQG